ncbi:hypothetical protein BGS_1297 [Beggiatoa sp. SS]|nr:hypothetical protein BGS_1297 [Beggiatoa sp. SS]
MKSKIYFGLLSHFLKCLPIDNALQTFDVLKTSKVHIICTFQYLNKIYKNEQRLFMPVLSFTYIKIIRPTLPKGYQSCLTHCSTKKPS